VRGIGIGSGSEPRPHARPAWLSRNLVVLTIVSLTQDTASELLYPLLPILLTGILAAPPVVLGVTEAVADFTAGITRWLAGRWSDRRGRRPFVAAGYGFAAIGKVLVAAATVWPMVLAGRVVDRFGKGVRSAPRDALIAESVPAESLGRAFGFHRAGDSLGAVVGPLLGLWALAAMDDDVRAALWWAVLPATLSALLVVFVREPARERAPGAAVCERSTHAPVAASDEPLPRRFWIVTATLATIALVNFSDALLLLRVLQLGFSTTEVVLAYVLFNAVYTLCSYPAGALADRWPRPLVYAVGLTAFGVGYLGLGLTHGGATTYVLVGVYGVFPAFTDGVGKAWVASVAPRARLGHAQGVFQALNNAAVLVAGVWAGATWNLGRGRGEVPLMTAGAIALCAAVTLAAAVAARGGRLAID
jgi:MFS family permease